MLYVRKENDLMVKYEVTIDVPLLEKMRKEIIDNCGIRQHQEYETDCLQSFDPLFIRNCVIENSGNNYHLEYDEIIEPKLSYLIGLLLDKGDVTLLDILMGDIDLTSEDVTSSFGGLCKSKIDLIYEIKEELAKEVKDELKINRLLDNLMTFLKSIELNENLKEQSIYLEVIKDAITFSKIGEIDYDTYLKVTEFARMRNKD